MAGPGKQRKLGPGPQRGVCGSHVCPGSCVESLGACASLPAARSRRGETSRVTAAGGARPPAAAPARGAPSRAGPAAAVAAAAAGRGAGEPRAGRGRLGGGGRRRRGAGVGGRRHVTAIVAVLVYKVPPARRAPHLSCARPEPEVLQVPGIQRDAQRTDGGDMGRAMVARLGLGLLLLALLLPTQIYSTVTTSAPLSSNSSQNTSTTPNPANTTTKAVGGALQSTASLFVVSLSLLHLYC
uniref:Signal transducer CD24 n=2 Tax=Macaca fascicularis TaxID=9541 RepID=A0A2K5U4D1_MACFA